MSNWKIVITHSLVWLIKSIHWINIYYIKWVSIFLNKVNIVLEIQKLNYIYLTMQQRATGSYTSSLEAKPDLDNLKG